MRPEVKYESAVLRSAVRSSPVLCSRSCAAQRTRVRPMSAWRQSVSAELQLTAISRDFSCSSRTRPSGSLGAPVISSSSTSSLMPRSCSTSAARFSTVNIASSRCAVVSRWLTLWAMSSASIITCAKSVLSTMDRVDLGRRVGVEV